MQFIIFKIFNKTVTCSVTKHCKEVNYSPCMGAFKKYIIWHREEEAHKKVKQSVPGVRQCNKKGMSLTQSVCLPISATSFLFLCIS